MDYKHIVIIAKNIQVDANKLFLPPIEGYVTGPDLVIPISHVSNTRGYIEKTANQVNLCYNSGCYDACLVMIRKILEILIIECYEYYKCEIDIKDAEGNYYSITKLIDNFISSNKWTIGKTAKKALKEFRIIGHDSAHNRRTIAHRSDIDNIKSGLRYAVQELIILANLK